MATNNTAAALYSCRPGPCTTFDKKQQWNQHWNLPLFKKNQFLFVLAWNWFCTNCRLLKEKPAWLCCRERWRCWARLCSNLRKVKLYSEKKSLLSTRRSRRRRPFRAARRVVWLPSRRRSAWLNRTEGSCRWEREKTKGFKQRGSDVNVDVRIILCR